MLEVDERGELLHPEGPDEGGVVRLDELGPHRVGVVVDLLQLADGVGATLTVGFVWGVEEMIELCRVIQKFPYT